MDDAHDAEPEHSSPYIRLPWKPVAAGLLGVLVLTTFIYPLNFAAFMLGDIVAARKSCSLVMYATDGTAVARYHLEMAWPSKLEVGGLKAGASEVLYETVTLVCEHIQRVAP